MSFPPKPLLRAGCSCSVSGPSLFHPPLHEDEGQEINCGAALGSLCSGTQGEELQAGESGLLSRMDLCTTLTFRIMTP